MRRRSMPDEAKLREELARLDARRRELDRQVRETLDRQRYATDPDDVAAAERDERASLLEMDRLMTRIRAVEGQLIVLKGARPIPAHLP